MSMSICFDIETLHPCQFEMSCVLCRPVENAEESSVRVEMINQQAYTGIIWFVVLIGVDWMGWFGFGAEDN